MGATDEMGLFGHRDDGRVTRDGASGQGAGGETTPPGGQGAGGEPVPSGGRRRPRGKLGRACVIARLDSSGRDKSEASGRSRAPKPYIGEIGEPFSGPGEEAAVGLGMVALSLAVGFVVGLFVWVVLWLSRELSDLLWVDLAARVGVWWLPVALCSLGGLAIGLWTRAFHNAPRPLGQVLDQVKKTGAYSLGGVGTAIVSFLLPIAFGGSVGPEAGLTGIVAAGCTWIGATLRRAGVNAKEVVDVSTSAAVSAILGTPFAGVAVALEGRRGGTGEAHEAPANPAAEPGVADFEGTTGPAAALDPDDYTFRRSTKAVLYCSAALGGFGGIALMTEAFGSSFALPRFGSVAASWPGALWFFACLALAYAMTIVYHATAKGVGALGRLLGSHEVAAPVICGVMLGCVGVALPDVMFSGATQTSEIIGSWTGASAFALLATGLVKAAATPFCVGMGWRGGIFFPCIYAGVSCGYGVAALAGADPMLCVVTVTTAFLAGATRRPLLAIALLLLCFPIDGILWMGLAALAGACIPLPKALR
ncbi:MAG: chloride channel protein [Coriobacteriales bacterium]|jgi:H+/Cl- antiporter ClcA